MDIVESALLNQQLLADAATVHGMGSVNVASGGFDDTYVKVSLNGESRLVTLANDFAWSIEDALGIIHKAKQDITA